MSTPLDTVYTAMYISHMDATKTEAVTGPAIVTKYLGPTNTKGSRVRANGPRDGFTWSWDHALGTQENHRKAAESLAVSYGWNPAQLIGGWLPNSGGYVFILAGDFAQIGA